MAEDLRKAGFSHGLIISDNRFIAGNMHVHIPDTIAFIPGYNFEDLTGNSGYTTATVMWEHVKNPHIPPKLADFVEKTYNIKIADYQVNYYKHLYKHARTNSVVLAVMQIPVQLNTIEKTTMK